MERAGRLEPHSELQKTLEDAESEVWPEIRVGQSGDNSVRGTQ